ncbi:putative transmembrane protein [Rhizoctonia solani 123E]|uniref:Putative transmembrane protein n=1 Tax=Rhizoctonia solani 123E TaxID=1423351 RepID=A0A074RSV6_9AGAM|nr:putative transmembrane protein [Rhizoctonia solani 123E]
MKLVRIMLAKGIRCTDQARNAGGLFSFLLSGFLRFLLGLFLRGAGLRRKLVPEVVDFVGQNDTSTSYCSSIATHLGLSPLARSSLKYTDPILLSSAHLTASCRGSRARCTYLSQSIRTPPP